jgi:hypothetical protein
MRLISGDGWEGPVWRKGVELGFKTDTFKVKGKGKPFTTKTVQIYLWIFLGNMEEGTGGREEILMTVDYDNAVDLGNGWFDYTITISKKVSVIHGFEFKVVADSYFIDDLRAINTSK